VNFEPKNLLVIHFGQLGDVVLGLPAMKAIRDRFPDSRRTAVVGAATAEIVRMAGLFDDVIPVDRVRLLKGNKFSSSVEIINFGISIRRKRFDFVIDLHSLPETNLLGYFSGATQRLFSQRDSRSLDFLSNFDPAPPAEDKTIHLSDYYLNVLSPLGIIGKPEPFRFDRYRNESANRPIVGLNPGAGNPSRRWPSENFIELARNILDSGIAEVEVLIGPEDGHLVDSFDDDLKSRCSVNIGSSLNGLVSSLSRLSLLVSNDTGPAHVAALTGIPIVLLRHSASPDRYLPLTRDLAVHRGENLGDIPVASVFSSVVTMLNAANDSPETR
jgi:ADP-heptose:LPS heptosyltransferase